MDNRSNDLYELLDLAGDHALSGTEKARLEAAVAASPELQAEALRTSRLHDLLRESRVVPREGFRAQVMARLPAHPAWAPAPAVSGAARWRLPVAALLFLAVAAALLIGLDPRGMESAASASGLIAAIGGMLSSTLLAGAGLIGASWRGVGMALGEALTLPQQVVFGVAVVGLNLLLFRLVRRSRQLRAAQRSGVDSDR